MNGSSQAENLAIAEKNGDLATLDKNGSNVWSPRLWEAKNLSVTSEDELEDCGPSAKEDALLNALLALDEAHLALFIIRAVRSRSSLWAMMLEATKRMSTIDEGEELLRNAAFQKHSDQSREINGNDVAKEQTEESAKIRAEFGETHETGGKLKKTTKRNTFSNDADVAIMESSNYARKLSKARKDTWKKDPQSGKKIKSGSTNKAPGDLPVIIQFSSENYFCIESEGEVVIDVVRFGPTEVACSAEYGTRDHTAKAGVRYVKRSGIIEFKPGELTKEIWIPVVPNESFDATVEFEVFLHSPQHAILARYLSCSKVKIIDDDDFPTNRFHDMVHSNQIENISKPLLLLEYFKMNFNNPVVRRGTLKMICVEQMHNLYFVWRLILVRYVIDTVVDPDVDVDALLFSKSKEQELTLITIAIVAPLFFLHMMDFRRLNWKVGGTSLMTLQANLLRKFLNYTEESRNHAKASEMIMAMTRDCNELALQGYGSIMPLMQNLGRMFLILLYQVIMPILRNSAPDALVVSALFLFPIALFAFLAVRNPKTTAVEKDQNHKQTGLVTHLDETVENFQLISDYGQKGGVVESYEMLIRGVNGAIVKTAKAKCNNKYFAVWLCTLMVGLYTLVGGLQVSTEDLDVGAFIVNLQIFASIGESWGNVYDVALQLQSVFPALIHIVFFMNLPVDFSTQMELSSWRRTVSTKAMETIVKAEVTHDGYQIDLLPIDIVDMRYEHPAVFGNVGAVKGNIKIMQGSFAMFLGAFGQGKTTLLKIIGGTIVPRRGLFVPPHLRVLHISDEPLFFTGSLMQNLVYGVSKATTNEDGSRERVVAICRTLEVPEYIIKHLHEGNVQERRPSYQEESLRSSMMGNEIYQWGEVLSLAERILLSIARALITNPEVLCMHKPTMRLDDRASENLFHLLRKVVDERGLEQDQDTRMLRRPVTIIVTQTRRQGLNIVDQAWQVQGDHGLKLIVDNSQDDVDSEVTPKEIN